MEQNNNLKWVTSAQALGNYNLMLSFNDGVNKVVNCKPLIDKYKIFTPLLDKSVFEKFSFTKDTGFAILDRAMKLEY